MKSVTFANDVGQPVPLTVKAVVEFTNATLPAVAFMLVVPVASAVGSAEPLAPPANCTR